MLPRYEVQKKLNDLLWTHSNSWTIYNRNEKQRMKENALVGLRLARQGHPRETFRLVLVKGIVIDDE